MYTLSRIKRIAIYCFVVLFTAAAIASPKNEKTVTGSAAEAGSSASDMEQYYKEQLEDIKKQQNELDELIASADSSINGEKQKLEAVVKKAAAIREEIETIEEYSARIEDEMASLDEQMRDTMYALEEKEEEIREGVNSFMGRVRAMYVAGSGSYTDILINSDDFYDILMRLELVKSVAAHDNAEIDRLLASKADIEETRTLLEQQSAELKEKSQLYGEQQAALAEEQSELLALQLEYGDNITQLEAEIDGYVSMSAQLESEYDKVSSLAQTTTTTTTTTTTATTTTTTTTKKTTTKKSTAKTSESAASATSKTASETTSATTAAPSTQSTAAQTSTAPPETAAPDETAAATASTTTAATTTTTAATTKPPETPAVDVNKTKAELVVSYAKSMVGGRYVWGGSSFKATDCSGLVMLSYAQAGITLPHKASWQANYGTSVAYSDMQPGDCIFFGGSSYSSIYHVAIYIGDGRMVHAENTYTGIVISNVASFSKYNHITCIKRML